MPCLRVRGPWHHRRVPRLRTITPELPSEIGVQDGLAYTLWLPRAPARGGVVVLHGAGSCKENHHDFARAALGAGLAAVAFDQRGHGDSDGALDGRVLEDVRAIATLLRARLGDPEAPIALRGSSMGGYLALVSAGPVAAAAVVAVCPAGAEALRRGLAEGRFTFAADEGALDAFLAHHDEHDAIAELEVPVLLLHAEGDEQVPVEHSRELARARPVEAEPPDRGSRRPPPLGPARPRSAGGEPAVHPARADALIERSI